MKKYLESLLLLIISMGFCFIDCNKGLCIPVLFSLVLMLANLGEPMGIRAIAGYMAVTLPFLLLPASQVLLFWRPGPLRRMRWINLLPPVLYLIFESRDGITCPDMLKLHIVWGPVAVYLIVFTLFRLGERKHKKSDPV